MWIIKRVFEGNTKVWDFKLKYTVWDGHIRTKCSTGNTPFDMVYGMEVVLPIGLGFPMMKLLQEIQVDPNDM